ncbi:MAG: homocysteine S-methyltransferase family protein [Deltaproteobacteria bacterium]|jgi:S-methylmethionine-dependent homocysteine/selenocysteine methylase|nr:homocysteine S-methyltransferase family protein [Deltaproteobacteria bacterium]MBT4638995.1 homocysteine S-methyltransferase family protein [Deltaproteobacteria bacterium]MBT6611077.1 homocysteine S-methyltransferase family protein [Deltaproteobacteria bacterium]MBT7710223.1 homocysteine S-methyltransferase family protein [Deltaproteobacteria bacterium]
MSNKFESLLNDSPFVLTEGAIGERLKHEYGVVFDEHIIQAGLIYDAQEAFRTLYTEYIDIAQACDLPIMLMTPTRKVNTETLKKSVYYGRDIVQDCCALLQDVKATYKEYSKNIFLGGVLGCKGNAYIGNDALSQEDAYDFHRPQVTQFREQGLDFLFAAIIPAVSEAVGMASAMAEAELPYIISFMIRKTGRLLDGTPLSEAIQIVDSTVHPRPLCYMTNCVHPSNLKQALMQPINKQSPNLSRFIGLQANASSLSPEELDQSKILQQGDFDDMVQEMLKLYQEFGIKIMGGCCGTDNRFLDLLAQAYVSMAVSE